MSGTAKMVRIFGVLTPVMPAKVREKVQFRGPKQGGIIWEYTAYPSWEAAARKTGLSVSAMRWKLERR